MDALRPIDQYFESLAEPASGCMQALRSYLLAHEGNLSETWKYRMPVYLYHGKMFCYLWTQKGNGQPYLGIVNGGAIEHPDLVQDNRKRMKILLIDPKADLPLKKINTILQAAMAFQLGVKTI